MELQKNIGDRMLQISTVGQMVKLTKGQSALLKAIRACVQDGRPINWDLIVNLFYHNVSKVGRDWHYVGSYPYGSKEWFIFDIMEEYKAQSSKWQYNIRGRVKQWFVSTIGVLVIKNQLIVIPTIEMEEPPTPTPELLTK